MLLCIIVLCELWSQMFHCLNTLQFIYLFNKSRTFDSSLELLWIVLLCALCICVSGIYSCFFASSMPWNIVARVQLDTSFSSVQFSCSVVSDSLQPHGLQYAGPPCSSPTPGIYSSSHPLSQWWHPTIWSSVVPFSLCLQSFPASGSFQMSQFSASGN